MVLLASIAVLCSCASAAFFASYCLETRKRVSHLLCLVGLALLWWACSSSFVLFNRYLLGGRGVHYPVLLTWTHMAVKGVTSLALVTATAPRGSSESRGVCVATLDAVRSAFCRQQLTLSAFCWIIVPLSAATALDVCFSNLALQFAGVAVYTMTKSSSIIFTLFLTCALRIQRVSWQVSIAVIVIGLGILLTNVKGDGGISGDWRGFACALFAALCGALRWVLTERWFGRPDVENNALVLIVLLSPVTVLTLVPAVCWELPGFISARPVQSPADLYAILGATLGGGVLATAMVAVELQFVSISSALSLTVCGTLKDLLQIGLAAAMFKEQLSKANAVGVLLTLGGSTVYGLLRRQRDERSGSSSSSQPKHVSIIPDSVSALPPNLSSVSVAATPDDPGRAELDGVGAELDGVGEDVVPCAEAESESTSLVPRKNEGAQVGTATL